MNAITAHLWAEAVQDRRHPLHLVLLLLAPLVPVAVHRYVVDLVGALDPARVGSDWFAFGALGLVVLTVMDGTLRAAGATLQRAQDQGVLPIRLAAPAPWSMLPIALGVWPAVVHAAAAAVAVGLAWALGADLSVTGLLALVGVAAVGLVATAGLASAAAGVGLLARRGEPLVRLFTLATALLSGAVFPIEVLPAPLRAAALVLPHTHAIRLARAVAMPVPPGADPAATTSLTWLVVLSVGVLVLGFGLLRGALAIGRRDGLLAAAA